MGAFYALARVFAGENAIQLYVNEISLKVVTGGTEILAIMNLATASLAAGRKYVVVPTKDFFTEEGHQRLFARPFLGLMRDQR